MSIFEPYPDRKTSENNELLRYIRRNITPTEDETRQVERVLEVLSEIIPVEQIFSMCQGLMGKNPTENKVDSAVSLAKLVELQAREINYCLLESLNLKFIEGLRELSRNGNTIILSKNEAGLLSLLFRLKQDEALSDELLGEQLKILNFNVKSFSCALSILRKKLAGLTSTEKNVVIIFKVRDSGYLLKLKEHPQIESSKE